MAHACAQVATADAIGALDWIAERAGAVSKKSRDRANLEVKHRIVLAAHNRLKHQERKERLKASRTMRELKANQAKENRLRWRGTVGI